MRVGIATNHGGFDLKEELAASAAGVSKGAYILAEAPGDDPEIILIASGSEVSLAVDAHEKLISEGIRSRVVSMLSWDIFEQQPEAYRESVLHAKVTARISIEQASAFGWERYVGPSGRMIGMHTSEPLRSSKNSKRNSVFEPGRVVEIDNELLGR